LKAVAPAVVGLALTVAGCGSSNKESYPAKSVNAFVRTCRAQPRATDQYCRCVIDELQAKLAYADFKALDEAFSARRTPNRQKARVFYAVVERCRTQAGS
jgi:hypothetical protein